MSLLLSVSSVLFALSLCGLLLVFAAYPLLLWATALLRGRKRARLGEARPSVTIIVVVRNGAAIIEEKVRNCLALDYPVDRLDFVFYSDGSTDGTEEIIGARASDRLRLIARREHMGKAYGLNAAAAKARGEILVFSDTDALLAPESVAKLVRHYADTSVGGVCGQRVIARERSDLKEGQSNYIRFDSHVKLLESALGSVTSNDGKLYSLRRALFRPIAPSATDDLYAALNIVAQGARFTFEPDARAYIRLPSRSASHEIARRRRIVSRSLWGILNMRRLLNPFRHGLFAIGLFINKVLRRMLPVFLALLFVSSVLLSFRSGPARVIVAAQVAFYLLAAGHPLLIRFGAGGGRLMKASSTAFYFCVGMLGTLMGVCDFLCGKGATKWDPLKTD